MGECTLEFVPSLNHPLIHPSHTLLFTFFISENRASPLDRPPFFFVWFGFSSVLLERGGGGLSCMLGAKLYPDQC